MVLVSTSCEPQAARENTITSASRSETVSYTHLGGALYGRKAGAWLGGVFGFVVMLMCITGGDGGGAILWNANPVLCGALCMVKGIAAGWAAACMYKAVSSKSDTGAVVSAAIISPVVNTGIFIIGVLAFFQPTLLDWAGVAGMDVVNYIRCV